MEPENQRDKIIEQLELLNTMIVRQNSVKYTLWKGVIYGIGFFIGSAVIATIALGFLGPLVGKIGWVRSAFETGESLRK